MVKDTVAKLELQLELQQAAASCNMQPHELRFDQML